MKRMFKSEYFVQTDGENKKILLLSDIHYCNEKEKKYLQEVLEDASTMEYDYLCISGDLLDKGKVEDVSWLLNWLTVLGKLSKVIIGIGNHEQASDAKKHEYAFDKALYNKIKKIKNVRVLDNEAYVDGNIRFIGITLPLDYYYKYKESRSYFIKYINHTFPTPYKGKYNILLCHTPIPFFNSAITSQIPLFSNISLVLCGHMHGGLLPRCLWRIGRGRGIIGPFHRILPSGSYGKFYCGKSLVIVSSGITKISQVHFLSFFNFLFRREMTMISLQSKK